MSRGARIAGAVALWLGALVIGLYFTFNSGSGDPDDVDAGLAAATTAAETTTSAPAVTTPTAAPETTTTALPDTTTTTVPPATTTTTTAAPTGTQLAASLSEGRFSLAGIVPDEATVESLVQAATVVYGDAIDADLSVDPEAAAPPWLAQAPQAITLLPIIGTGMISANAGGVAVSGSSPNADALTAFETALEATLGVDADVAAVEITERGFPSFNARRQGDSLVLSGVLGSRNVKDGIVTAAQSVYGEQAVDDQLAVDDNLDVPFWSYTMPGVLQLFAPFPDYEITIENGITGGSLNAGANFAVNSAELNDDTLAILPIALGILTRDPSLGMEIAGHTDSTGDPGYNQSLSEARAEAAAAWLIDAGVDPGRIRAAGFGESQPIADNDSTTGRALNRRVEFRFGPLGEILGN